MINGTVERPSVFTISLGGIRLREIRDPELVDDANADVGHAGTFATQDSARQFERRDVAEYQRTFSKGMYCVEDDGTDAWRGGYAWGEGVDMWSGNGVRPSGRLRNIGIGLGVSLTSADLQVLDSVMFMGDLWCITNGGSVIQYVDCDVSVTPTVHVPFAAGFTAFCMEVFSDDNGHPSIYVGTGYNNVWRLYQYCPVAVSGYVGDWTAGEDLGYPGVKLRTVWWQDNRGVGAQRLALDCSGSIVRICIQGDNPLLVASWGTPIKVGNIAYDSSALAASPGHLFVIKRDGIHDFNELRAWNATPIWQQTASASQGNWGLVYDDHLMAQKGPGIYRYDLRLGDQQDRLGGECGPGSFMQTGSPVRGYPTAYCEHDGWFVVAMYNPDNQTSYIIRGKDRRVVGETIPCPMVWHGAEQVLPPVGGAAVIVTHMRVVPAEPFSVSPAGPAKLLMFVRVGVGSPYHLDMYWAPLPTGGGPLGLQVSGGPFEYNHLARLYLTALVWGDRNADKSVRLYDVVARGMTGADGDPRTITDQSTWVPQGVLTAGSTSILPVPGVVGKSIALQLVLVTEPPYTDPPVFHELSPRARVVRQAFEVRKIWILLERDQPTEIGSGDPRGPHGVFAAVSALQNQATATTYTDEFGRSYAVYVEQPVTFETRVISGRPRLVAGVELSLIA
jgi:hypothetical protein